MRLLNTLTAGLVLAASQALALGNDRQRDFVQMCNENGFASESYTVITEDGYVS